MNTELHQLPKITVIAKKRLGRGLGSGKGSKSGRGTTRHQSAREAIPLHFEGGQGRLVKKFPLLRGKGRNNPKTGKPKILKLEDLNRFEAGAVVDLEALVKAKVIETGEKAKVLGNGELKKKLTVKLPVSKSAKAKIEALGGQVTA